MTPQTIADLALSLTVDTGGFTIDCLTGESPTKGFVVGGVVLAKRIEIPGLLGHLAGRQRVKEEIISFLALNREAVTDGYGFFGGWIDGDTLILDVVSVEKNEEDAVRIASGLKETAYFNLTTGETVYVN
jgi:hypothetical protein